MTDKKPEQTPCEIIAKLAAMSDKEFSQFMAAHFARLCAKPLPPQKLDGATQ